MNRCVYITDIMKKAGWNKKQISNFYKTHRPKKYCKDVLKYGFETEVTWSLDLEFILNIYAKLKRYDEVNIVNTNCHKVIFCGKEHTFQESIDYILNTLEKYLVEYFSLNEDYTAIKEETRIKVEDAYRMLAEIIWLLWW